MRQDISKRVDNNHYRKAAHGEVCFLIWLEFLVAIVQASYSSGERLLCIKQMNSPVECVLVVIRSTFV